MVEVTQLQKVEQSHHFLPYVSIHFQRNKLTHYCIGNIAEMLQSVAETTQKHKISSTSSKVQSTMGTGETIHFPF